MSDPSATNPSLPPHAGRSILSSAVLLSLTAAAPSAWAAECPDYLAAASLWQQSSLDLTTAPNEIEFEADGSELLPNGERRLNGNVLIRQGERQLRTSNAAYDPQTQRFRVDNDVEYTDPNLVVRGAGANVDTLGGATFEGAEFEMPATNARGSAQIINANPGGVVTLNDVRYTTCPRGDEDWLLRAARITVDQENGIGTGRGLRLDFKGVPILYAPFITFPVGDERKTGFLFPAPTNSSRSGSGISVPWYWNIAPNYDATFTPTWYSKRGAKLDTEFRYLNRAGRGALNVSYLPKDQEFGSDRSLVRYYDVTNLGRHLRLDVDAANVSDSRWFEDFGFGQDGTSVTYLNRSASLTYLSEHWYAVANAQNFQIVDDYDPVTQTGISRADRPYTPLPQIAARAEFPRQAYGLTFALDTEFSHFTRHDAVRGMRLDVAPEIRMPLRAAGIYLEPSASWRYTAYDLRNVAAGSNDSPTRSAPILSIDGGMAFERNWGDRGQRLQTLEPRVMYLYVPYRNQDDLPLFDTTDADLNLVQLFRTNRYVGADRLSDANQISVGLTSRLLDADTGQQFIAATIGQAYYFDEPKVRLPGEPLDDTESSDIVAELEVTAYRNWNVRMGVQWDPGETRSEKGEVRFQYKPAFDRVMNLGYRFRRGSIEQVDGSVAWPISERWSGYGRMVYSLQDESTVDQFAGLEYRACCWRLRLVARRAVSNREGDIHTDILLQFELNGLSSVGDADAFLQGGIRGYSLRSSETRIHR